MTDTISKPQSTFSLNSRYLVAENQIIKLIRQDKESSMQRVQKPRVVNRKWAGSTVELDEVETSPEASSEQYVNAMFDTAMRSIEKEDYETAEVCLRRGLFRMPEHPESLAYLAICVAENKRRFAIAEKIAKEAVRVCPGGAKGHYALGRINLLGSRRRAAFRHFLRARKLAVGDQHLAGELDRLDPRRPPVIADLPRDHALNIYLGRVRGYLCAHGRLAVVAGLALTILVWIILSRLK